MLKKHALSMAEGSASFILAALGCSTYRTEYGPRLASLCRASFAGVATKVESGFSAAGRSLAAAALDGLFDHPAGCSDAALDLLECCVAPVPKGFFNKLLGNS